MNLAHLLADAIARLERAEIPYMVTGLLASTYHGEPRATLDLDIVIDPRPSALERLLEDLDGGGFYVDREAARSALRERTQFNAIGDGAAKVDFIIRKDRPFSAGEFGRRRRVDLLGTPGFIVSVEDLIIAKIEWAAATDSDRQLRDVAGMLAVGGDAIDHEYLTRWITALGLTDTRKRAVRRTRDAPPF